jgi:tetratricopeptide (TPR) repeat protein
VFRPVVLSVSIALAALLSASPARATDSGDELVRQARAHEALHEDDVAMRRYTEALTIDPVNEAAWLGLGALRLRMGEPAEAERVFDASMRRIPGFARAVEGRAHARWALGRHPEAEGDLEAYVAAVTDADALRELAGWYQADGRTPAQLGTWRKILAMSEGDDATHEARRMVRALVILVGGADPASAPAAVDATRKAMAAIAKRGG